MLEYIYYIKTERLKVVNTIQKFEYVSRTLKVLQVLAIGFALAQLTIVVAVA